MTPECIHCLLYILMATLAIVAAISSFSDDDDDEFDRERNQIQEKYLAKTPFLPAFLTTPGNITVNKGEEAILPCAVEHRGTRTVVWRMASNPSPITIGVKTYVSDTRFKVVHPKHSLEWNLHIMNAQPQDSGVYECQVSAVTRHIRQHMGLTVRDTPGINRGRPARPSISSSSSSSSSSNAASSSEITIKGSFFVEKGDTMKLQCNAVGGEYKAEEIDWFKDGDKIKNTDRITLDKHVSFSDRTITSTLQITRGRMEDAGTYVCRTSDLQVTSVKVNVLNTMSNNEKRAKSGNMNGVRGKFNKDHRDESKDEQTGYWESSKRRRDGTDPGSGTSTIVVSRTAHPILAALLSLIFIMLASRHL